MNSPTMTVVRLLIADDPSTFVTRTLSEVQLEFGGIPGDRHFGITAKSDSRQPMYPRGTIIQNRRQLSLVSVEELEQIAAGLGLPEVRAEWLGANIVVQGFPELTMLPFGSRILLPGGGGLWCDGENEPCVYPGKEIAAHYDNPKLAGKFVKAAFHRRGIVASVERPGTLKVGDELRILLPGMTK